MNHLDAIKSFDSTIRTIISEEKDSLPVTFNYSWPDSELYVLVPGAKKGHKPVNVNKNGDSLPGKKSYITFANGAQFQGTVKGGYMVDGSFKWSKTERLDYEEKQDGKTVKTFTNTTVGFVFKGKFKRGVPARGVFRADGKDQWRVIETKSRHSRPARTEATPGQVKAGDAVVKLGHRGEIVRKIESMLVKLDFLNAADLDDVFDYKTDAAVRAFQKKHGLGIDGKVGGETYPVLEKESGGPSGDGKGKEKGKKKKKKKERGKRIFMKGEIVVYGRKKGDGAESTNRLIAIFKTLGIKEYTFKDIGTDEAPIAEFYEEWKELGRKRIPVVVFNGEVLTDLSQDNLEKVLLGDEGTGKKKAEDIKKYCKVITDKMDDIWNAEIGGASGGKFLQAELEKNPVMTLELMTTTFVALALAAKGDASNLDFERMRDNLDRTDLIRRIASGRVATGSALGPRARRSHFDTRLDALVYWAQRKNNIGTLPLQFRTRGVLSCALKYSAWRWGLTGS